MNEEGMSEDVETPKDPRIHRSDGMKCATCMWYVVKATHVTGGRSVGRCRRHSPCINGYPAVFGTDWCGDHKLDENKI